MLLRIKLPTLTSLLLCCLALLACGRGSQTYVSDSPQVEDISDPNAYPSVVMVFLPGGGLCTGTFISPRAVLTAAHCTKKSGTYSISSGFGYFVASTIEALGPGVLGDPLDVSVLILDSDVAKRSRGQVAVIANAVTAGEKIRIVGYGCNNLSTRKGAGTKRSGTNHVSYVDDFIHLQTPFTTPADPVSAKGILGPRDQAGSCFGDSGGPMFRSAATENGLVGTTHAGGAQNGEIISEYINIQRSQIQSFLRDVDLDYSLGIFDVCKPSDPIIGPPCSSNAAGMEFIAQLKSALLKVMGWINVIYSKVLSIMN